MLFGASDLGPSASLPLGAGGREPRRWRARAVTSKTFSCWSSIGLAAVPGSAGYHRMLLPALKFAQLIASHGTLVEFSHA